MPVYGVLLGLSPRPIYRRLFGANKQGATQNAAQGATQNAVQGATQNAVQGATQNAVQGATRRMQLHSKSYQE